MRPSALERWAQGRGFSPGKRGAQASRDKTEVEGATGAGKTHPASINLIPWEES